MRSFLLKPSRREEGPYSDSQIGQMFADGRVNRYAPCRKVDDKEWKTIDDYLPMLKYGTQLPPPTPRPPLLVAPQVAAYTRVALVDLDIPFLSILKMMFKWMAAAFVVFCCFSTLRAHRLAHHFCGNRFALWPRVVVAESALVPHGLKSELRDRRARFLFFSGFQRFFTLARSGELQPDNQIAL